jgi:hypothetical protein
MTRVQLVFRRDGERDQMEHRFDDDDGEPKIDGRLTVDGDTYVIRGVEWLVLRDDIGAMSRFVCTLVVEPTAA